MVHLAAAPELGVTLLAGASRSQRYRASAAFLAAGAVIGCGSGQTVILASAGSSAMSNLGSAGEGVNGVGGLIPTGTTASGGTESDGSNGSSTAGSTVDAEGNGGVSAGGMAAGGEAPNAGGFMDATAGSSAGGAGVGGAVATGGTGGSQSGGPGQTCAGATDVAETLACRDVSDCSPAPLTMAYCNAPGYASHARSSGLDPAASCSDEVPCTDGWVCRPDIDGVSRCRGTCSTTEDCRDFEGCADGECFALLCDDGGRPCITGHHCDPSAEVTDLVGCAATSCLDGFECDPGKRCDPSLPTADEQGCATIPCTTDAECDCGFCLVDYCRPTLGTCVEIPLAMPYGCVWPDEEIV